MPLLITHHASGGLAMQMSELQKRIITGLLAATVSFLAVWYGGVVFFFYIILLAFLASLEFDRMRGDAKVCFVFCAVPILMSQMPIAALLLVLIGVIIIMIAQHTSKQRYPWLIISVVYISLPAIALIWLRYRPDGLQAVIWLVLTIIATDTGAYFAGRKFGKNLLAPAISPKKTWEGLAGGAIAAGLVSFAYTGKFIFLLVGLVFAVAGQLGDLIESGIKRYFGVKDSGNILPGHGGVMDRVDSFTITAPLAAIAAYFGVLSW